VDLVYVSHCLEHFSHHKIRQVLSEWRRVLKPGGILRLGVPDFDVLLAIYHANENNVNAIEQYLMGGQTYPLNAHYSIFTKKSLTELLFQVGFREVREWRHGSDDLTSLNDCTSLTTNVNGETLSISLNLEAIK
jgi:predicted SAM-dependent methyltransferase